MPIPSRLQLFRLESHSATVSALFLAFIFFFTVSKSAAQEPYRFYGGDVEGEGKSPAVEACEYEELVEGQRCNRALNKTRCIESVREECRERAKSQEKEEEAEERGRRT